MSKVDELKLKYPSVQTRTFNKFVNSDKTPTKKYLEFLLKSWINREYNNCPSTSDGIIDLVCRFEDLLPYIENKDIYGKDYTDISLLKLVIARAEEVKDEKTFVKEEHITILHETDDYLLITPLTHRGSLKYGAGTRWCTASKHEFHTFQRYSKGGLLGYVIDKTGKRQTNYQKIALYHEYSDNAFSGDVNVFNAYDSNVEDSTVMNGGWSEEELHTIFWYFRAYFLHMRKTRKSKDFLDKFTATLGSLDFKLLSEHIKILEQSKNLTYISTLEATINNLFKNLNNHEYGFAKTKD